MLCQVMIFNLVKEGFGHRFPRFSFYNSNRSALFAAYGKYTESLMDAETCIDLHMNGYSPQAFIKGYSQRVFLLKINFRRIGETHVNASARTILSSGCNVWHGRSTAFGLPTYSAHVEVDFVIFRNSN